MKIKTTYSITQHPDLQPYETIGFDSLDSVKRYLFNGSPGIAIVSRLRSSQKKLKRESCWVDVVSPKEFWLIPRPFERGGLEKRSKKNKLGFQRCKWSKRFSQEELISAMEELFTTPQQESIDE